MKGRNTFTEMEIKEIRRLLVLKNRSSREKQVEYRNSLRKLGFYITDFDQSQRGFTTNNLENLLKEGKIKIL
jgi:hypothetical protein